MTTATEAHPARNRSARGTASSDRRSSARSSESRPERTTPDTRQQDPRTGHENPCHLGLFFLALRPQPGPPILDPSHHSGASALRSQARALTGPASLASSPGKDESPAGRVG